MRGLDACNRRSWELPTWNHSKKGKPVSEENNAFFLVSGLFLRIPILFVKAFLRDSYPFEKALFPTSVWRKQRLFVPHQSLFKTTAPGLPFPFYIKEYLLKNTEAYAPCLRKHRHEWADTLPSSKVGQQGSTKGIPWEIDLLLRRAVCRLSFQEANHKGNAFLGEETTPLFLREAFVFLLREA